MERNRAGNLWMLAGALIGLAALAVGCGAGGSRNGRDLGPITIRDSSTPTPDPYAQPPAPPVGPLF